jgi:hypothetical protein
VQTVAGNVEISQLLPGDLIFTANRTWRRVLAVTSGEFDGSLHNIPHTGAATPGHHILHHGKWMRISETGRYPDLLPYVGKVYNLLIHTDEPADQGMEATTEHSYRLANGIFAHNSVFIC